MRKSFKKIIAAVTLCAFSLGITAPVYANVEKMADSKILSKSEMNELQLQTVNSFEEKGISVVMSSDGKIRLANPTAENISNANQALAKAKSSYPTEWVHMPLYDVYKSKHLRAATASAFASALTALLSGTLASQVIINIAVANFGITYFVNSDEEDIYCFIKYYYRELGPGSFDMIGNFMGDYEIKKVERITKNSNGTGGDVNTDYQESTTLNAVF